MTGSPPVPVSITRRRHFQNIFSSMERGVCPNSARNCLEGFFLRLRTCPRSITTSCSYAVPSICIDPNPKCSNRISTSARSIPPPLAEELSRFHLQSDPRPRDREDLLRSGERAELSMQTNRIPFFGMVAFKVCNENRCPYKDAASFNRWSLEERHDLPALCFGQVSKRWHSPMKRSIPQN